MSCCWTDRHSNCHTAPTDGNTSICYISIVKKIQQTNSTDECLSSQDDEIQVSLINDEIKNKQSMAVLENKKTNTGGIATKIL